MDELFPTALCLASVVSKNKNSVHMWVHLRERVRAFPHNHLCSSIQEGISPDYIPEDLLPPPSQSTNATTVGMAPSTIENLKQDISKLITFYFYSTPFHPFLLVSILHQVENAVQLSCPHFPSELPSSIMVKLRFCAYTGASS